MYNIYICLHVALQCLHWFPSNVSGRDCVQADESGVAPEPDALSGRRGRPPPRPSGDAVRSVRRGNLRTAGMDALIQGWGGWDENCIEFNMFQVLMVNNNQVKNVFSWSGNIAGAYFFLPIAISE